VLLWHSIHCTGGSNVQFTWCSLQNADSPDLERWLIACEGIAVHFDNVFSKVVIVIVVNYFYERVIFFNLYVD